MYDDSTEGILRFSHLLFSSSSFLLRCRPSFNRKGRFPFFFLHTCGFLCCTWTNECMMCPVFVRGRACLDQWYCYGHRISFSIRRWMQSMRRELNDHSISCGFKHFNLTRHWKLTFLCEVGNRTIIYQKKKCRASQMLIFHF